MDETVFYSIVGVVGIGVAIFAVSKFIDTSEKNKTTDEKRKNLSPEVKTQIAEFDNEHILFDKKDNFAGIDTRNFNAEVKSQWRLDYGSNMPDTLQDMKQWADFDKHMRDIHSGKGREGTMSTNAEQFAKQQETVAWQTSRQVALQEAEKRKADQLPSITQEFMDRQKAFLDKQAKNDEPKAVNKPAQPSKVDIPKIEGHALANLGVYTNPLYKKSLPAKLPDNDYNSEVFSVFKSTITMQS
jgi:hypothetical protein